MKIAFLTNEAREIAGGAFFSQKLLVEALNQLGYESVMIATKTRGGEKKHNFRAIFLDAKYGDFGRVYKLYKLQQVEQFDVIIGNMKPQLILLAILRFFIPRKKLILAGICRMGDHYLSLGHSKRNIPLRWLLGKLFSRLNLIIAISKFTAIDVEKTYFLKHPITVIYNPFNVNEIRSKADEFNPNFSKKTIINVGRLVEAKAQYHLIDLASELQRRKLDFQVVVIGQDGECKEPLTKEIKKRGLEQTVILLGHKENPFPYIKHADLFVLTSSNEGFGRVIVESMLLETPVVAFRSIGGHIELLENERGFLVDDGDINSLADIVFKILNNQHHITKEIINAKKFASSLQAKEIARKLLETISTISV